MTEAVPCREWLLLRRRKYQFPDIFATSCRTRDSDPIDVYLTDGMEIDDYDDDVGDMAGVEHDDDDKKIEVKQGKVDFS